MEARYIEKLHCSYHKQYLVIS